ncbi:hypothetical protein N431DRAFT_485060 [Stipitochalara longipes BDJ]|nr:hypothetical protein N431DRAFT_485060 [Stipitochalara longipes BDJ]
MDRAQSFKSIRERKQKVLGIYSFSEPIVLEKNEVATASSVSRVSQAQLQVKTKRDKSIQAQRKHRQRTRDYIVALEAEIESLRNGETHLKQINTDWKRCTAALIGPSREPSFLDQWVTRIKPGIFIWTVSNDPTGHIELSSRHLLLLMLSPEAALGLSSAAVPPSIEIYDGTVRELLLNFCQNITPTLDVTETASHGYAKHIIPLAMESDMVRNALLAASASQKGAQSAMRFKSLVYRSAAIRGLQQTSKELQKLPTALFTLATILGLLIDDMINENKDFPALVKLADSCIALNPFSDDQSHAPLLQFILDQIQMIKALAHPLYKFSQGYNPSTKSFGPKDLLRLPCSPLKMCDIFASIENATAQACSVYNLRPALDHHESIPRSNASSSEIDILLDTLRTTVNNVPPFTPGENSLVWVYSIAASRSSRPEHCAFFTSRLAELLRRIGHQDISGYLSALSIFED